MSRDELVERFSLERVGASPATFDYAKLDWMNGVYLRALDAGRVRRARWSTLPPRAGPRLADGADPRGGAARAGEDRDARRVPRLRRLPLRGGLARRRAGGRATSPVRAADARSAGRAVRTRADRGGAARHGRAPGALAAEGVPARSASPSPGRRSRRGSSRASSCSAGTFARAAPPSALTRVPERPGRRERVERALEGDPRTPTELRRRQRECVVPGNPAFGRRIGPTVAGRDLVPIP